MSRSLLRQKHAIKNSTTYDDTLAAGATLQSGAAVLEDDMNAIRSQLKRIGGLTNWYDDVSNRDLATVESDLAELESQTVLFRAQLLTDITVPASQNWKILSVAGSEAPTQAAALGSSLGAVVAQTATNGAGFDVHELDEVAGASAISPKNLVVVREGDSGEILQSSLRDVYGLLQFESTGSDQDAFDDTSAGSRVKISFVRINADGDDLEAVPVADIENQEVNYSYVRRIDLDNLPEDAFLSNRVFLDHAAAVDVTLDRAIDNQGATPATQSTDIEIRMDDTVGWAFKDSTGTNAFFQIDADDTIGDAVILMDAGTIDIDSDDVSFNNGITVGDEKTRPIDIAENDGVIESTAGDLEIRGFAELYLDDGNQTGSTWAQTSGIKLSDSTAEWDAFEAQFGEVSLLAAIVDATTSASRVKASAVTTAAVTAGDNLENGTNLSAVLADYSGISGAFADQVDIYLDGQLMLGAAGATDDVYPGTTPANGDFKATFDIESGVVVQMFVYGD